MASLLSNFIEELRRRRVFRVAAFYGGIAFVVIQIIDGAFDYLHIPEWVGTTIIFLLLIGFPIAMGLAWAFDITPEGIVRTEGRQSGKPGTSNRALVTITILAVAFGIWGRWGARAGDDLPIIAVLPFLNYSEDSNDWFADGFTDVLTSQLAKLSDIGVISRTSTMHYKQTVLTAIQVGRELGASAVLEGSIFRSGGKVRITSQLIDTRTDRHLWSETYERRTDDFIALQADVAFAIAQALKDELTPQEARDIMALPTANTAAYEHYLMALSLKQNLELHPPASDTDEFDGRTGIIAELQEAIALDPAFAEAHAQIVLQHGLLYFNRLGQDGTPNRLTLLTQSLNRAEAMASGTVPVRLARGVYYYLSNHDYRRALEYFEPLLAQAPNNPEFMSWVGYTYRRLGLWDEGLDLLVRAADFNPQDAILATEVMETYRSNRRYEEADRYFKRLKFMGATDRYRSRGYMAIDARDDLEEAWAIFLEGRKELGPGPLDEPMTEVALFRRDYEVALEIVRNSPTFTRADSLFWSIRIYGRMGQKEKSRESAKAYLSHRLNDRQSIRNFNYYSLIAMAAAAAGDSALAVQSAEKSADMMNPEVDAVVGSANFSRLAGAYLLNNDLERGLDFLEQSQAHPNNYTFNDMKHEWVYDTVRDHPRYIALMERLKGGR